MHKKISVNKILSNPFRDIKRYPLDEEKVKRLMDKMTKTKAGFHDNLLVRPHPTKKDYYELGYGHHRIESVRRLGITEIEPSVCDLDDAEMLLTMFDENSETTNNLSFQVFTVETAKKFLDDKLAEYKTLKEFFADTSRCHELMAPLLNLQTNSKTAEATWSQLKKTGVGGFTIFKFLNGEGVRPKLGKKYKTDLKWTQFVIEGALAILKLPDDTEDSPTEEKNGKKKGISRKAVMSFPSVTQADAFRKAVTKYPIPKEKQVKLAKKLADEGVGKRNIEQAVKKATNKKNIDRFELIEDEFKSIVIASKNLTTKISGFISLCHKNKVRELKGTKVSAGLMEIGALRKKIEKMLSMEPHNEIKSGQKLLEGDKS